MPNSKKRNRILIGHSFWGRGGAEIATMHLIKALCDEYEIDIVTRGGFDLEELNHCAGTRVQNEKLGAIIHPPLAPKVNAAGGAIWHGLFLRYCRYLAPKYDLCVTASRTIDWGVRAVHFLSDVAWNNTLQIRFNCQENRMDKNMIRRVYFGVASLLAGRSGRELTQHDILVANSQWTANVSAEFCRQAPVVIYPAIPSSKPLVSADKIGNDFICLGRISPEKRIEQVIAILEKVRGLGHSVRLHLAGNGDDLPYLQRIQELCASRRQWVTFHGAVYADDKRALMGQCRFGISACDREAFGIATAEMAAAGLLPFVPESGAQSEIIQEEALIYKNIEDAVIKIDAALKSASRQTELRSRLLERMKEFLPERFSVAVRNLVRQVLLEQPGNVN